MADGRAHQIILLAGALPLLIENSRLHAQGVYVSVQYEIVAVDADESTLLPVIDRLRPEFFVLDLLHANGLHMIRRITNINSSCHILVVTGLRNRDGATTAFASRAAGVFYRDDLASELHHAIRMVGAGHQFMSSTYSSSVHDHKYEGDQ